MGTRDAIIAITIMAVITLALRAAPFIIFGRKSSTPKFILYLGDVLPYAIMGMLVVYSLKNMSFTSVKGCVPEFIAGAATALSYVWKRNTLLSILIGTVGYMLLVQFVF